MDSVSDIEMDSVSDKSNVFKDAMTTVEVNGGEKRCPLLGYIARLGIHRDSRNAWTHGKPVIL